MAKHTKIEWADSTLNIWFGCTKVSPARDHCYAEAWAKRSALVKWGPGEPRVEAKHWRAQLEEISRAAKAAGRPWFVFVNSLSDFFDNEADDQLRTEALAAFRQHPHLTIILLTKRIGNADAMIERAGGLPPNCAVMITVIDQPEADRDSPKLLALKAKWRPAFVGISIEPMLGPVSLRKVKVAGGWHDTLAGWREVRETYAGLEETLDWVITGGETDQGAGKARPLNPDWFRSLRDQCATAGVPYLHKQNGEFCEFGEHGHLTDGSLNFLGRPDDMETGKRARFGEVIVQKVGKARAGRLLDGVLHDGRPGIAV